MSSLLSPFWFRASGSAALTPAEIAAILSDTYGAVNYWDAADSIVSGANVVAVTDRLGSADLLALGGHYPQRLASGRISHDGTAQYLYSTDATLLGRVNGDDESATLIYQGRSLFDGSGQTVAAWTAASSQRKSIEGATNNRWRFRGVGTTVDGGTYSSDFDTFALRMDAGVHDWRQDSTSLHSNDFTASGAFTPIQFMIAAFLTTSSVVLSYGRIEWSRCAVFPAALSDAEITAIAALLGAN